MKRNCLVPIKHLSLAEIPFDRNAPSADTLFDNTRQLTVRRGRPGRRAQNNRFNHVRLKPFTRAFSFSLSSHFPTAYDPVNLHGLGK